VKIPRRFATRLVARSIPARSASRTATVDPKPAAATTATPARRETSARVAPAWGRSRSPVARWISATRPGFVIRAPGFVPTLRRTISVARIRIRVPLVIPAGAAHASVARRSSVSRRRCVWAGCARSCARLRACSAALIVSIRRVAAPTVAAATTPVRRAAPARADAARVRTRRGSTAMAPARPAAASAASARAARATAKAVWPIPAETT
jgi:hypothetical protein